MSNNETNPLEDKIPNDYLRAMALAAENGYFVLTLVVGYNEMDGLRKNKPVLLKLENGTVILMVTQAAVEKWYEEADCETL